LPLIIISNVEILENRDFRVFEAVQSSRKVKAIISSSLIIFKINAFILLRMAARE